MSENYGWLISLIDGQYNISTNFNSRFVKDKTFFENGKIVIISDGVILNKTELGIDNTKEGLRNYISLKIQEKDFTFFKDFIGPFNGAYIDKYENRLIVWGNQTGDSAVFYYTDNKSNFIISNNFNIVYNELKVKGIDYKFNENAGLQMLTFGYIADDSTFVNGIHRLQAGKYIIVDSQKLRLEVYHRFNKKRVLKDITVNDAVEIVDKNFRRAVKRCFEKDLEYDYSYHLSDLSGGLDSRMTTWVAHDLGYNNIVNMHYSQSKSLEYQYCSQIARHLGNELYIKNLDDASFIFDIEELVYKNYGMSYYAAITGGNQMLKSLNFDRFGLEHTGQLGGLLGGAYISKSSGYIDDTNIRYSKKLNYSLDTSNYEDNEIMAMYVRGFNGILASHFIRKNYTYAVAPFLDPIFIQSYLNIPESIRINHKLYMAWIKQKYPEALEFKSTSEKFLLPKRCIRRAHAILSNLKIMPPYADYANMNPFDYWYNTDFRIQHFINSYFKDNFVLLESYPELAKNVELLFHSGNTIEKLMSLTVIAAKKVYD